MDGIRDSVDVSLRRLQELVKTWHAFHGVAESDTTEQLINSSKYTFRQFRLHREEFPSILSL